MSSYKLLDKMRVDVSDVRPSSISINGRVIKSRTEKLFVKYEQFVKFKYEQLFLFGQTRNFDTSFNFHFDHLSLKIKS